MEKIDKKQRMDTRCSLCIFTRYRYLGRNQRMNVGRLCGINNKEIYFENIFAQ